MKDSSNQTNQCDINFGKVQDKSVKVYKGEKARKDIEIIGSRGSYSIWTDPKNTNLKSLRGKTGSLKEVKGAISKAMCGTDKGGKTNTAA